MSLITAICPVCIVTVAETPAREPPITPVAAAFNSESIESKPRMTAMMLIAVLLSLDLLIALFAVCCASVPAFFASIIL